MSDKPNPKPKVRRLPRRFTDGYKTEGGSRRAMVIWGIRKRARLYRWRGKGGRYYVGLELPAEWNEPYWETRSDWKDGEDILRLVWNDA